MKKALALVLALVLALSMAVSAFGLVELKPAPVAGTATIDVPVIDVHDELYTHVDGYYYIALDAKDYKDVAVSTTGNLTAEVVKYDPATMNVTGIDGLRFEVVGKDGKLGGEGWYFTVVDDSIAKYEAAVAFAKAENDALKANVYSVVTNVPVNVIKVTVADNYTAAYTEGTLKITATLNKVPVSKTLRVINDVTIFEYEQVKWAAKGYNADPAKSAYLELCDEETLGYSDYDAYVKGYNKVDPDEYIINDLRTIEDPAVVSTTAFRAITGETLKLACAEEGLVVTLKNIVAGQKGVNFKHYTDIAYTDLNGNFAYDEGEADAIEFGFLGNQVVLGDFTVAYNTGYTWFTLREAFGEKVEEDDIISYYVLKNGKVVKEIVVDYMTANIYQPVVVELDGSNSTLGQYQIVMEVPAVEGETNPNTGAESVVGVVAALAVVSVATAAAVSLKK
ncbi:MAG: hypothetical protein IJ945_00855 [Oscillospiraceae bacterium]|nr:hypothetical protein [Oscillospiraceae bacterium]